MKTRLLATTLVALLMQFVPASAFATIWIRVSDVSQLQYQTGGSRLYFRNLHQFSASALGCCYNYWIDTATTEGKNMLALVLSAAAQRRGLWFGLPDGYAAGQITNVGEWNY